MRKPHGSDAVRLFLVQVLQQYERGARDINGAKLPTLLKICNALECRLADIITDEETLELLKKYEEH